MMSSRRLLACVALVTACAGSAAPTAPAAPGDVAGSWSAPNEPSAGRCAVDVFGDAPDPRLALDIRRPGASIAVDVTDSRSGNACLFIGTSDGSWFEAKLNGCSREVWSEVSCTDGTTRTLILNEGSMAGHLDGRVLEAGVVFWFNTFVESSGAASSREAVRQTIRADRE